MRNIYVLLLLFFCPVVAAQQFVPRWDFKINVGYNIGGTSPLPMPEEIRSIERYSPPGFSPHVAVEATRRLSEKWGISAQLTLDHKGFTVRDSVFNLHTEMELGGKDPQVGNFTGHNQTKVRNSYLTLPVMASYFISEKWMAQAGFYVAYLYSPGFSGSASDGYFRQGGPTGEKTEVDNDATFDFSDELNKFDFGLVAAGEWSFSKYFALRGQLAWGLISVFPSDFTGISYKMYNIYGTIGVSYKLRSL